MLKPSPNFSSRRGSALLLVLASLLLLTVLVVAFLTRATLEKQLSSASSNFGKTDLAAQGAIAMTISDLQQEIVAGSNGTGTPSVASGYYYPTSPTNVIPQIVGFTPAAGVEDLVKISKNGAAFYTGGPSRAANVNTANNPSLNSRSVSTARWNKPLLMAKATPSSTTDFTPVSAFTSNPPDWIYVARDGSNPTIWDKSYIYRQNVSPTTTPALGSIGTNATTQRYAYAIYDEGSTLDMNVAGNPSYTPTSSVKYSALQPYKSALAYADLTQLPYLSTAAQTVATGSSTTLTAAKQVALINAIVGWRNFSSAQLTSSSYFPTSYSYSTNAAPATLPFDQAMLFNPSGYMTFPATSLAAGPNAQTGSNQSDNVFASRQQLMQFLLQGMGQNTTFSTTIAPSSGTALAMLQNVLPYLGTFSRDLSQPSYAPPTGRPVVLPYANGGNSALGNDSAVNPSLLNVTITTAPASTVTRNNGAPFVVGEPLLKKRFALNRLAWVTYNGPSASRTQTDADIVALTNAGIPSSFLALGTAANIQSYFGLNWDSTNHVWKYNVHNGTSGTGTTGAIMKLGSIAALTAPHEPDFFEILKATIGVGSLAKALANSNTEILADAPATSAEQPTNYNYYTESSVDFQVLQIGANIIDQYQPANWPVQIVFDDGTGAAADPKTIVGVENLPYLYTVMNGALQIQQPAPLPRMGKNSYGGSAGTGVSGDSGYQSTDVITASGVGAWMQLPIIWNPHDPSSSTGAAGPTNFRVVADSATPDQVVASSGTYNSFFVYGTSVGVGAGNNYSCNATSTSPGYSWFGDTSGYGGTNAHQFKNPSNGTGNAEVDFTVSAAPTKALCPEPMILMRPGTITDNNGNSLSVSVPSTHFMNVDPVVKSFVSGGGLPNFGPNAAQMQSPETMDPANTSYIGFYLGAFPFAWTTSGSPCSAAQSGPLLSRAGSSGTPPGSISSCYMTYRMQYQDPNNASNWITYDTKYGKPYLGNQIGGLGACAINPGALVGDGDWAFMTDPRSSRFGLMANGYNDKLVESGGQGYGLPGPELDYWSYANKYGAGWIDTANGIMYTSRPDGQAGFYCKTGWPEITITPAVTAIGPPSGWMAWIASDSSPFLGIVPGLLSQNNTDIYYFPHHFYGDSQGNNTQTPNYFADPDGMVRRGMGAFVQLGISTSPQAQVATDIPSADTTVGLPLARAFNWKTLPSSLTSPNPSIMVYSGPTQATSQAQSRPFFLHRPFYSVGELGYAFSDTPWRNLDFFTAESGNTALLDAFCINDTTDPGGLVAGKINLNTRQVPVLQAVLAEGYLDPVQPTVTGSGTVGQLDATTANLVAKALVARTTDTANLANGTGPLRNLSELVGTWQKNMAINDLGSMITGVNKTTLSAITAKTFYDGKLSYAGFSGGVWDNSSSSYRKPYVNGVENFSSSTGAPASTGVAEDVYSAYYNSASFTTNAKHNGTQETSATIQRFREAPIRSLAAAGTTRVWNLMIDVIAQTGRFPSSAGSLASFNVEGERRYWVHVAIDRYTGKVLDEQVEEVKE